jgi:methyl-accepting chemotaxis protein
MKLTIGQKIAAGYSAALLIMAVIGIGAYRNTEHLVENANWVTHTHQVLAEAENILFALVEAEGGVRGYVVAGDERYLQPYETLGTVAGRWNTLRELTADNPAQQSRLDRLQPLLDSRRALLKETVELRRTKGFDAGAQVIKSDKGRELMSEIRNLIVALQGDEQNLLRQRDQQAKASAQATLQMILYGSILGLVLVAVLGVAIHRSIARPLAEFHRFVTAVGEGDLTQASALDGGDELGRLAQGLNRMVSGLKDVAGQTRGVTENLNSAVVEILASAKQQAASTGERVAACQETNATMQQVSQSCLQMAEKAKQVAATAEAISIASHSGLETVQNTNRSMESIREQAEAVAENVIALSEKTQMVGEIVATVNDIAEQSHLLALNAAIEAAAAGEHGRSFSVVAGEIKNLADQSKEATVQVKSILGDIQKGINSSVLLTEEVVKRVELGKRLADQAASTTREMTSSIQESVQAFQQIRAGTNQQQIGFEHVMQAVKDIGQSSEQAAASTRQMERSAADLAALGQQLRKATDRYRL